MEKLKAKIGKHEHSLTDLLKVIIFSIVMLAPIFAIATKCMYVAFNKNAYESYSGTSTQYIQKTLQTNEVNNLDDLVIGNVYELEIDIHKTQQQSVNFEFVNDSSYNHKFINFYLYSAYNINLNSVNISYSTSYYNEYNFSNFLFDYLNVEFRADDENAIISMDTSDDLTYDIAINYTANGNYTLYIIFQYNGGILNEQTNDELDTHVNTCPQEYLQYTTYYEEVEVSTLDNVFYYSVDEVDRQPLFNWTKNTAMYSGINNMISGLDMGSNNVISILLTYWVLISLIYIVFDIVIFIFTKITHALQ